MLELLVLGILCKEFAHICKANPKIWKAETENDQLQPERLLPACSECAIGLHLLIRIHRDGSVPYPPLGFQKHWLLRARAANAIIETAALLSEYFIHSPLKMLMDLWHVLGLFCRCESQTQPLVDRANEENLLWLLVCCLSFQRKRKGGGEGKAALRP